MSPPSLAPQSQPRRSIQVSLSHRWLIRSLQLAVGFLILACWYANLQTSVQLNTSLLSDSQQHRNAFLLLEDTTNKNKKNHQMHENKEPFSSSFPVGSNAKPQTEGDTTNKNNTSKKNRTSSSNQTTTPMPQHDSKLSLVKQQQQQQQQQQQPPAAWHSSIPNDHNRSNDKDKDDDHPPNTHKIDNTTIATSNTNSVLEFREFERHAGVVIATKIHGPQYLILLHQSLCLLHQAYNHRVLYDIVVFTTEPLNATQIATTQALVAPAKLTVVVDNRGSLHDEIAALTPLRRQKFLERCNVTNPQNLTWWSECPGRIAYNWQAEFRAWHLWTHPALAAYQTMLWMDTDGFCTRVWNRDPVAVFLQHNLTILFDNFPRGKVQGPAVHNRIYDAFEQSVCRIRVVNGKLATTTKRNHRNACPRAQLHSIHGFFHITNLNFYRSPAVQHFLERWIGDCFLCREFDDQAAVTLPAAVWTPHLAWDMRWHNVSLQVFHNYKLDGKDQAVPAGFLKYWKTHGPTQFPQAFVGSTNDTNNPNNWINKCPILAGG